MILGLAMVSESEHSFFLLLRTWWLSNINYRCVLYMFLFNGESSQCQDISISYRVSINVRMILRLIKAKIWGQVIA